MGRHGRQRGENLERRQLANAAALLVAAGLVESQDDALEELAAYHAADPRLIVVVEENASTIGVGIGPFDGYRGMLRRLGVTEAWRRVRPRKPPRTRAR